MRASVAVTSHWLVSQEEAFEWCPAASLSALAIAAAVVVPSLTGLQWCPGIKNPEILANTTRCQTSFNVVEIAAEHTLLLFLFVKFLTVRLEKYNFASLSGVCDWVNT